MPSYLEYGSWILAILCASVFLYVQWRNESKIPEDYEGMICGRCRKPCEEDDLSSFEGLHIHFLKLLKVMPTVELEQLYCSACKLRLQQLGYFFLALVIFLIFLVIVSASL